MCVWVEDADKLEINSKELSVVYYNRIIEDYFKNSSTALGLAGIKGQGKTFLLKVKRKQIGENESIICLPNGRIVDIIDCSFTIDRSLNRYLKDYNVWVQLWKFCICGSILTCTSIKNKSFLDELKPLAKKLLTEKNYCSAPSFLFKRLLNYRLKDFIEILDNTGILVDNLMKIDQPICVFIDKLDQGFSNYLKRNKTYYIRDNTTDIWQYVQYALAECSYDIFTSINRHIKVYYTIRQEALIKSFRLNKDKARNINAYISVLSYDKIDLQNMYNLYIVNENEKNLKKYGKKHEKPSEAFIGFEDITHGYISEESENVFDYIYRHTFKRPYDIMKICRRLYLIGGTQKQISKRDFRHEVNAMSNELLDFYLEELSVFLPYSQAQINYLLKLIPGNILNMDVIKNICSLFSKYSENVNNKICNKHCLNCLNGIKPFSVLYNIGLIGFVTKHDADSNQLISFVDIGQKIIELNTSILPSSEFYFLHPAISNKVRDLRCEIGLFFQSSNNLIIGDSYEILPFKNEILKKEAKKINDYVKKEKVFVSSTISDLKKERGLIREQIRQRNLFPVMSEFPGFDVVEAQNTHTHDHCLNEIKKCGSLVFIIGEKYGEIYSGSQYKRESLEIRKKSDNKIVSPSISLMELYIARKYKLKCYVFFKNVEGKKVEDEKIQLEIEFINNFMPKNSRRIKGNWITYFKDLDDLKEHFSFCTFN